MKKILHSKANKLVLNIFVWPKLSILSLTSQFKFIREATNNQV